MKRSLSILLVLLCGLATTFASERTKIRSIQFNTTGALSERELIDVMKSKQGAQFFPNQLTEDIPAIVDLYHRNGYCVAAARIDSLVYLSDSSLVDVMIGVDPGDRLTIGMIEIRGDSTLPHDRVLQSFETRVGGFLIQDALERDLNTLISGYERSGYPFATAAVQEISPYDDNGEKKLHMVLSVDKGSRVTIDEIRVEGNTETNERIVVREARVPLHEAYDEDKVAKIPERLNRLNIFSKINDPQLYVNSNGSGGLLIGVQEGSTNTFDGVVGYAPGNTTDERGIVTGLVNISMRNLFGTARKLNVRWQRDAQRAQEVGLQYVEPWVLDLPVNASGAFNQRQQDTLYVRRDLEARADVLVSDAFSLDGTLTHESVIPTGNVNVVSNSRTITTGLELRYDTRDDIVSPASGVDYRTSYRVGNKKTFGAIGPAADQTSTVQKVTLDAEAFVPTFLRQVVALGLHGRQLTSGNIELSDLYRFGGTNSLRGYRENQFLGSRVAWTNAEYRFLLARRSYFFGFLDGGYYFLPGDDTKNVPPSENYKYGYGVGLRLETSLGNIGVSFAFGEGDTFTQGKIHLGLMNEF